MFDFLKKDFREIYDFIVTQINPQVTQRLNTLTTAIIGFVENRLREIKPTYIDIYNRNNNLITNINKIGFVNFYHSEEFSNFMKNEFGYDLKNFDNLKVERNKSGSHIERLTDTLADETIEKYYYTLFNFTKAYYEYKTKKKAKAYWNGEYVKNLLIKPTEKVVEIEKIIEVEKIVEKKVVDSKILKQNENEIIKLSSESRQKDKIIDNFKKINQEYKSQAERFQQQTVKTQTEKQKLEEELEFQKIINSEVGQELEKQKEINLEKAKELKEQKKVINTPKQEIGEVPGLIKNNSSKTSFSKQKKIILFTLIGVLLLIVQIISIAAVVRNKSNRLIYYNNLTEYSVSIDKNYDKESFAILPMHNGKKVTKIVSNGGKGNKYVQSIEIPDTVKIIDSEAFKNFTNLKMIIISKNSNLEKINSDAFNGCKNLKSFYVPQNVCFIAPDAFKGCVNLTQMSFEDENNWCLRADSTTNYQDIYLNNQTDNAQMFTSIYCKYNWYKKFYVTYNLNGGVCAINPSFYTVNDSFKVNNPTKYGYKFLGWSGSDLNTLTKNLIISNNSTKDKCYTANWEAVSYSIMYEVYGGNHSNPTTYTIEDNTIILKDPTLINNKFLGWYLNPEFTGSAVTQILTGNCENITLYAKWTSKIEISSAQELIDLSNSTQYWGGIIILTSDIDLNGVEFKSIGNPDTKFTGVFDGNGYEISNFKVSEINVICQGFFGVTNGATIKNLGLSNCSIISLTTPNCCAGGIVALAENTTILNCYSNARVSANGSNFIYAGGIVGYSSNTTISNCYSSNYITANSLDSRYEKYVYAGGIVGYSEENTQVTQCFSLGPISAIYNGPDYYYDRLIYKAESIGVGCQVSSCYFLKGQQLKMDYIQTTNGFGYSRIYDILVQIQTSWDTTIWNIELPEEVYIAPNLPIFKKR